MTTINTSIAAGRTMAGNESRLRDTLLNLRRLKWHDLIFLYDKRRFLEWLRKLYAQLDVHIHMEEDGGYFERVVDTAPHLVKPASQLRAEHARLMESLGHILDEAEQWRRRNMSWRDGATERPSEGSVDSASFCRIVREFRRFDERLSQHEHAENALMLDAVDTDIGGEG